MRIGKCRRSCDRKPTLRATSDGWLSVRGIIAGIRLGLLLEIAAIGMRLGFYAVQPIPGKLIVYGSFGGIIEMVIVGAMVGAIYKPASARQP